MRPFAEWKAVRDISIHTLRVEGDRVIPASSRIARIFQSTPSAWRVTVDLAKVKQLIIISIHTLRVEGDRGLNYIRIFRRIISIHTLRMEGDVFPTSSCNHLTLFQSTPSAWRVTRHSSGTSG